MTGWPVLVYFLAPGLLLLARLVISGTSFTVEVDDGVYGSERLQDNQSDERAWVSLDAPSPSLGWERD